MDKNKIIDEFVENSEGMKIEVKDYGIKFTVTHKGKKKEAILDWVYCALPSGISGYRLELNGEDITTVVYNPIKEEFTFINW